MNHSTYTYAYTKTKSKLFNSSVPMANSRFPSTASSRYNQSASSGQTNVKVANNCQNDLVKMLLSERGKGKNNEAATGLNINMHNIGNISSSQSVSIDRALDMPKAGSNSKEDQRFDEAVMIFQVASYALIEQCMLDAGFSRKNIVDCDPLYIEFVQYAVGSEMNRINRLMQAIPEFSVYHEDGANQDLANRRGSNYEMMQKALIIFQVKICSILKHSMMQAKFQSFETYECNHAYITFARTALRAELNRITQFDVNGDQDKAVAECFTITSILKNNNVSSLEIFNTEHKVVFDALVEDKDGANNSTTVSTHASDSTRLMGSLTGRKRFFEQLSDQDEEKGKGGSQPSSKQDRNQLSAPVILNPYYYRQPFANDSSKDKRKK